MDFNPNELLTFTAVDMCAGWIGALLLAVVGFVSVRAADKRAGLLVGGAGMLLLVTGCCAYWDIFYVTAGGYVEPSFDILRSLTYAVGFFSRLAGWLLVVAGAVILARKTGAIGGVS